MRKIAAALTASVMLAVSLLQGTAFAAFSDVDDSNQYKAAISALSTMSVIDGYEDGTFKPAGTITRAEFTKLIVFMLGFQNLTYTSYTFEDASEHWAKDYIQTAYDRGIIIGFEDGEFKPEEHVTYAQVLKMVVCTLGYEEFADAMIPTTDGWADKYIQEGNALNLTKNVTSDGYYADASRGLVAQVLYNALETDMYENNGYNWIKTEKTLMKDYLKIKKVKGTLIGVEDYVTEDCKTKLLENQMDIRDSSDNEYLIDYSSYTTNISDLSRYLGSTMTVYYRQPSDNDEMRLISIDIDSVKNTVTEISYDDLSSLSGNTLKYYDSTSKQKTLKLKNEDLTVRYNGKLVASGETVTLVNPFTYEVETFTRQQALEQWLTDGTDYTIYGNVTLTDNSSDGTYDIIQIYDYETIVAYTTPTTSDYRITDKLVTGNYLILDPQSADYEYTITKNGAEIPITSIAANDVILYAVSLEGDLYTLLVSDKTVKGTVSSISSDGSKMTISGTTYYIGDRCASYIQEKSGKELKSGVNGTFYLDSFDKAVYGTLETVAAAPYAYITNAFIDNDEGGAPYITVYAPSVSSGEASSYPLKSSVKLNGSSTKAKAALTKIQAAAAYAQDESEYADKIYGAGKYPQNTTYAQPARVKISNNEVTEIVLLSSDEIASSNDDNEQVVQCRDIGSYTYSSNSFYQDGKTSFSVNSSTVVICVPSDRELNNKYGIKSISSAFTGGEPYYIQAYDVNSSKVAGLILLYGTDGTLTKVKKDTDYSVVGDAPESAYNEAKDGTVLKLDLYTGTNTAKSWFTYDTTEFSDVVAGDVIQFAYDSDNLIQGRINNIRFEDIEEVLDGETYNDQLYNWEEEQTPSEDNNYQRYKFDYRFKKSDSSEDETYTSSTLGTIPHSRAVMFNISQVLTDEKKLYVTKNGFDFEDGMFVLDDSDYEEITITSSTKILKMNAERDELSRYVDDTTTELSINDFKDAKNYGMECSKILVCLMKGTAKLIVIYE